MIIRRLISVLAIALLAGTFSMGAIVDSAFGQQPTAGEMPSSASTQHVQSSPNAGVEKRDRGMELFRQGKFGEAAKVLQRVVKENKTDDQAWYYLGLALQQTKKAKEAAKAFETAVNLRPNFADAHTGLAYAYLRQNRSPEAVREAYAALSIDPSLAEAHYIIGVVRSNSGDPEEALIEAGEVIKLDPNFSSAYVLKAQALVSVYVKRTEGSWRINKPYLGPQTPEQRIESKKLRLENATLLTEAAESLETRLRLNPSNSSADLLREQLETLKFYGSETGNNSKLDDGPHSAYEVTTKARVLKKREPTYTEAAREAQVTGTVALRAVFSSDGNVRHIMVLSGLPYGLTEVAVRAAKQIKFVPATIDGRPVSMYVQIEYNFNLY